MPSTAGAEPSPQDRREQVRAERQAADELLRDLTSATASADAQLAAAEEAVAQARQRLENARRSEVDAREHAKIAESEIARIQIEGQPIKAMAKKLTVESFVTSGIADKWTLFDGSAPREAVRRDTLRDVVGGDADETMEALRANEEDLEFARKQYVEAQQRAADESARAAEQVATLDAAAEQRKEALTELEEQIDQLAIRSEELRAIDAKLTQEIDRQNAEFAARLRAAAKREAEERAAAQKASEAAAAAAAQKTAEAAAENADAAGDSAPTSPSGPTTAPPTDPAPTDPEPTEPTPTGNEDNGSGSTTNEPQNPPADEPTDGGNDTPQNPVSTTTPSEEPATTRPPTSESPTTRPPVTSPPDYSSPYYVPGYPPPPADWAPPPGLPTRADVVTVGGITVHKSIASNLRRLLAAASADGIQLGGGGYRDLAGQLGARKANCGSSAEAIWLWSASSCHPPTARPGTSQHQKGLAIDFQYNGSTICFPRRSSSCAGNPAFEWLKANAATYGFYNLPSEAWHWSTTGS
jgi:hypothetical protein